MKKLVLAFVALAAISFASCGNKTGNDVQNDTITSDSDSAIVTPAIAEATAEDSANAWKAVGDTAGLENKDQIFASKLDSILKEKNEVPTQEEEAVSETAEPSEATTEAANN